MNPVLQTILISLIVGVMLAAVGFAFGRLGRSRDRKSDKVLSLELVAIEEVKTRDMQIAELQRKVQHLEFLSAEQAKAAIPITAAMEAMLIAKLTNAHTPEADALLKKATDKTLTPDDAAKLVQAMKLREDDPEVSEVKRLAAKILPDVMRINKLTEAVPQNECKTIMVTIPETETVAAGDGGTQEEEKGN